MPFEARKTKFTVFSLNHELYNLIKSAFNMKLESTSTRNAVQISKPRRGANLSLSKGLHRPKWTEQELPTSRIDRTSNKLSHR